MRTSKVVSITLPPAMAATAQRLARKEHRTVSELFREALRRYQREQEWNEINAYGRAKARQAAIAEADVVALVKQVRREGRNSRRKRAG